MRRRPRNTPSDLIRRAQDALEDEQFEEAEALGRRALMRQPDSAEARGVTASALIELGRYEDAIPLLNHVLEQDPDDLAALADAGLCLFEMCRFADSEGILTRALDVDPDDPQACYWMALCLERRGDFSGAQEAFVRANAGDPDSYPLPARLSRAQFDQAVRDALNELPHEIRRHLKDLTVVVEDLPADDDLRSFDPPMDPCLFGLYSGIPLPERTLNDLPRLPDTVHIYQRNLERMCLDHSHLVQEIRITLLHEIGHYLGFDEDDLAERGLA